MNITFDIETVPTENPDVIEAIAKEITPPGNMSKADTIAAWELEKKPALIEKAVHDTSFDGAYGRIISIAWAINDDAPLVAYGDDEAGLLREFFTAIEDATAHVTVSSPLFIGHYLSNFDLPFIWKRAVIHKIKPPACMPFAVKPWDKAVANTDLMWEPDNRKHIKLVNLCKVLDVPTSKGDIDGSKVWDYYKAGKIAEIADYNKGDVIATRECYRRMTFMEAA